jgi:hypothetical protein
MNNSARFGLAEHFFVTTQPPLCIFVKLAQKELTTNTYRRLTLPDRVIPPERSE